jgi:hypothetical protein
MVDAPRSSAADFTASTEGCGHPRDVIAVVGVEVLVLGRDEGILHQIGDILDRHEQAAFLGEFVDDPTLAGIDPADRGGVYCARLSWLGRSREYMKKIAPIVRAPNRIPSVTAVKMAPKNEPTNLITRAFPEAFSCCPRLYTAGGVKVKTMA